jgi:serine/threonine-protein kinase
MIFGKGSTVTVPKLVGMDLEKAKSTGFPIIVNLKEYNMKYPKGIIISQNPVANSTVKKGHPISVDISLGPKVETLPDFSNNLLQQVKLQITSLNFKIGKIVYVYSDKPPGSVLAQEPQAGTIYKEGEKISLLVSKGKKKPIIVVNNLVGMDSSEVIKTFKSMNYDVKIDKEYSLKYPVNSIINQEPKAGNVIKNVLKLTVNSVSQYRCFILIDTDQTGTLKVEKCIGGNSVYSRSFDYERPYMDYFFDYRPFTIKIYLNGFLIEEKKASLIK